LERAMAAAITDTPPPQLLRGHISKYDVSKTIDAVERLYLAAASSNRGFGNGTFQARTRTNSSM